MDDAMNIDLDLDYEDPADVDWEEADDTLVVEAADAGIPAAQVELERRERAM